VGCKRSLQPREAHQVRAQTEARALARRQANARGHQVQQRERHRRNDRHREDLLYLELLLGDDEGRQRHREALQEILNGACNELSYSKAVHTYNLGPENLLIVGLKPGVSKHPTMSANDKPQVFLEGDDEIRGQKYVCLSFLTPNRGVLKNKDLFFFSKFLQFYHMDHKIRATESFMMSQFRDVQNTLSDVELMLRNTESTEVAENKSLALTLSEKITKLRGEISRKTAEDMEKHVKENLADYKETSIIESYEKYMLMNRQRLEDEFHKQNNFQTTMHGLKVRGVYASQDQANARAKALNKKDPYFNVYVADVGEWLPWDPDPEEVKDQEYQSDDLNKLMQAYKENATKRDEFFEEEKRQKIAKAAAEVKAAKAAKEAKASASASASDTKKVFGEGEEVQDSAAVTDPLFNTPDLAMARKIEEASKITYA